MVRFILNFIFFGILFYLIYLFFPETFQTLVSWVNQVYAYLKEFVIQIFEKVQSMRDHTSHPSPAPQQVVEWVKNFIA